MAVVTIGFWSLELTPGKEHVITPPADIRITNAALSDVLKDQDSRTTVKLTYIQLTPSDSEDESDDDIDDDEPSGKVLTTVLCSLTPGKIEQVTSDLIIEGQQEYRFNLIGKNAVFLSGNYIDQPSVDTPPFDDDSDLDSDNFDLEGLGGNELEGEYDTDGDRFEEEPETQPPKNKGEKRPRENEMDIDDAEKGKKVHKKQKVLSGKVITPEERKKHDDSEKESKNTKPQAEGNKKDGKVKSKELAGGLKIVDTKIGTGPTAKKGSSVSLRYIGKLESGKIFDKNTKGKPFRFRLGKQEVIKGWDEGIAGMQVGGERKLVIPSSMGYGDKGTDGIPPKATLIFEVKLLEIK